MKPPAFDLDAAVQARWRNLQLTPDGCDEASPPASRSFFTVERAWTNVDRSAGYPLAAVGIPVDAWSPCRSCGWFHAPA